MNAGRVAGVFGLRGELKIDPSRIGEDALAVGLAVHAALRDGTTRELRIASLRPHKGRPLARFEGIDDATGAQVLVGATLALAPEAVVLQPGEYLDGDLCGCSLVDAAGAILGEVTAVEHFPAQDVLIVRVASSPPRSAMVPLVRAFVRQIDVDAKRIAVDLPHGLLDDREADQA